MPEATNYDRAMRARKVLEAYGDWSPGQREATMGDFLADLMHLARLSHLDWYTLHGRAKDYYEAELGEPDSPKDWSPLL